jgi:16S rRNA (guanine966-N2)-methyltransferase
MRIIAGTFGGRILKTVEGPGYRPAMSRVRESLFSMLESRGVLWQTSRVMDVFAGSGSLAFEALSRGALEARLVEMAPQAVRCLQGNARLLGLDASRCQIVADDAIKMLAKACHKPYQVVFIDPPYGKNLLQPTLNNLLRRGWLAENGLVCAEIEMALAYNAEKAHEALELLADRTFGQTRILIWQNISTQ